MKSCLEEYRDCDVKNIAEKYIEGQPEVGVVPVAPDETNAARIRGIHNEDASLTEGTVTYDIRFLATAPVSHDLQLLCAICLSFRLPAPEGSRLYPNSKARACPLKWKPAWSHLPQDFLRG